MAVPVLLIVAFLAVLSPLEEALAHAVLVEARPADGERLDRAPAALELDFSEPVAPIAVRLFASHGRLVEHAGVTAEGTRIIVRPTVPLADGAYILSYRVTSLDGHPVGASIRFGVGEAAPAALPDASGEDARLAGIAVRFALYLGLLGAAGLLMFARLVEPPGSVARRCLVLARVLAGAAMAAALLRLGIGGLELEGLPLGSLAASTPWTTAAATSLGLAALLAVAGAAALLVATVVAGLSVLVPALGLTALSFAVTGHAATAPPRVLTAPALGLHVLAAAFWAGSFLPLAWALRTHPLVAAAVVRRFATMAMVAVAVLAATGAGIAAIQLGWQAGNLWSTAYGLKLLAKLGLVAVLLAIAVINRRILTPRLEREAGAARRLRRLVLVDLVLAAGVLAITATFPLDPPPRALATAMADQASATAMAQAGGNTAIISFLPGRAGPNRFEAFVTRADGSDLAARSATLRVGSSDLGIEPIRLATTIPRPGAYIVEDVVVPLGGTWNVRLDLLVDDFTQVTFESRIELR